MHGGHIRRRSSHSYASKWCGNSLLQQMEQRLAYQQTTDRSNMLDVGYPS